MLKQKKLIISTILLIVILGIIVTYNQSHAKKSKHIPESKVIKTVEVKQLSKYPGLHLRTETEEAETYTTAIGVPLAKSDDINKPIQTWIDNEKATFIKNVPNDASSQAHLNIQLKTKKVVKGMYSLVLTSKHYMDVENEKKHIKPFTIDIDQGKQIELADIFQLSEENTDQLRKRIVTELHNDTKIKSTIDDKKLNDYLKQTDNWHWTINNDVFIIYIDKEQLAINESGTIKVKVPLQKLYDLMEDKMVKKLNKPKEKDLKVEKEKIEQQVANLDPNGKYIALTFDDGPSPDVTPRVLATLKQYDAKATFFMLGNQAEYYPDIVEEVAKNGHEIANHSKGHPLLTKINKSQLINEVYYTNDKIFEASGVRTMLFRPPYGAYDEKVTTFAKDHNYSIILWSIDSLDWKNRNANTTKQNVIREATPGAIVLMHDIHPTTADALPGIMENLTKQGYQFITVSELMALQNLKGIGPIYGNLKQ